MGLISWRVFCIPCYVSYFEVYTRLYGIFIVLFAVKHSPLCIEHSRHSLLTFDPLITMKQYPRTFTANPHRSPYVHFYRRFWSLLNGNDTAFIHCLPHPQHNHTVNNLRPRMHNSQDIIANILQLRRQFENLEVYDQHATPRFFLFFFQSACPGGTP